MIPNNTPARDFFTDEATGRKWSRAIFAWSDTSAPMTMSRYGLETIDHWHMSPDSTKWRVAYPK